VDNSQNKRIDFSFGLVFYAWGVFAYAIALCISYVVRPLKSNIQKYREQGDTGSLRIIAIIATIIQTLLIALVIQESSVLYLLVLFSVSFLGNLLGLIFLNDYRKDT